MKYIHTNIIAKDWEKLSKFYQDVFGCVPLQPRRDYTGDWIECLVGIKGVHVVGEHIALPGYDGQENAPTLEIFTYSVPGTSGPLEVNCYGFAHICFIIDRNPGNLELLAEKIVAHGGSILSTFPEDQLGKLVCLYTKDPEGNIVEVHY